MQKENIVKSILYACVISCMAGPMVTMLNDVSRYQFQLMLGFFWFLFYSAYLYDEITVPKRKISRLCLGLDLIGWMFFMGQACTIAIPNKEYISALAGWLGLIFITISLNIQKKSILTRRKQSRSHGKCKKTMRYCQWQKENLFMLIFTVFFSLDIKWALDLVMIVCAL